MKESDLYLPLKAFLVSQGYGVKGEVGDCDLLAVRGSEAPIVVELKTSLNLSVILQAVNRLSLTPNVYIGVPKQSKSLKRQKKEMIKLLRMLGLGLIAIDPYPGRQGVTVILDPGPYKPRISKPRQKRLLGEFEKRVGDPNLGGTAKKKGIITAYRQQAVEIAGYLESRGPTKASEISKALELPKARNILYKNHYNWFERISRGIYGLTSRGRRELPLWQNRSPG